MQTDLFSQQTNVDHNGPWAHELRPQSMSQFIGQHKTLAMLKKMSAGNLGHMIFHGPPGCGKTTLAQLIAKEVKLELYSFNAVLSGVAELRKLIKAVMEDKKMFGKKSIIFIDEIHRFNKAQQDALLPHLEKGDFIFFGATTENPQTSLNRALLSRVRTLELQSLGNEEIVTILKAAAANKEIAVDENLYGLIALISNGDARSAISALEYLVSQQIPINALGEDDFANIKQLLLKNSQLYDKSGDRHYDVISAYIKSVRGSDVDAALLWLAVMLEGGEDPDFIARRLIILASEDIGLADNKALPLAQAAHYAIKNIGMPEARIPLAHATTYLAMAPKSNTAYKAIDAAIEYVRENPTLEVPTHLRNHHPDKKDYKYPHLWDESYIQQSYAPKDLPIFYQAKYNGEEKENHSHWLNRKS
jgi:putative ATPase